MGGDYTHSKKYPDIPYSPYRGPMFKVEDICCATCGRRLVDHPNLKHRLMAPYPVRVVRSAYLRWRGRK